MSAYDPVRQHTLRPIVADARRAAEPARVRVRKLERIRVTATTLHGPYEEAVDSRSEIGDDVYSFDFDGVDAADAYHRTAWRAHQAHKFYSILVRTYDAHGYNARVARITQRQLNRAANAVADLIAAMS